VDLPPGVSFAAALSEGAVPILQRSVRYHRPRAPFCGTGACTNCLVRVNGVPNIRGCRYEPVPGDRIDSENAWPSPGHDLLGALDTVFWNGIDSVRGFRRPAFARPLYQWVVRRLAAFGSLPERTGPPPRIPSERIDRDIVVVGGGASGRAAAEQLAAAGAHPLLLDRSPRGGAMEGVEVRLRTTVAILPPPRPGGNRPFDLIAFGDGGEALRIAARRVILATGGYDAGLWFANGDRPGVLTAEGALAFEQPGRKPPFRAGILFGGGPRAAALLARWEDRFDAVVAPGAISPELARKGSELGLPLYPRSLLTRAIGRRRVRAVQIRGRGGGAERRLDTDAVVLAHRRLPNAQLLFQVGARMHWSAHPGAYFPDRSEGATSVPGLLAVGSVAGAPFSSPPTDQLTAVVDRALSDRSWPTEFSGGVPEPPSEFEGYYRELIGRSLPGGGRWTACACEDVGVSEILEAHERGYRGIEVIKRYTGVGTGLCQGRYCIPEALLLLAIQEGRPPSEVGYITQRPPVLPVPLESIAALPDPGEAA
jgi:sarcosine oxidase subunit alpha